MNARQADGATLREHLESIHRQTGRKPAQLEVPPLPDSMIGPWTAFLALHGARTMHAAGPNPITWPELESYQRQTGIVLASHEVNAVRAVDAEFLASHAAQARRAMKK